MYIHRLSHKLRPDVVAFFFVLKYILNLDKTIIFLHFESLTCESETICFILYNIYESRFAFYVILTQV